MKKLLLITALILVSISIWADDYDYDEETGSLLGEEPTAVEETNDKKPKTPKNPNVPGEVHKWQLALNTSLVNVNHLTAFGGTTTTTFGLPLTATNLAAGYQLSSQIWLMAKFHLFASLTNGNGTGQFLLGPGIRADFIRTDHISFFGGGYISIGSAGKVFLFSPEIFAGVEYNATNYLAIGVITDFAYTLWAANGGTAHSINFVIGPQLTVYF